MNELRSSIEVSVGDKAAGRIEKISLNGIEDLRLQDGSLLMRWHQVGTAPGSKQERSLDYATAIMPGYQNMRNLAPEAAWNIFNYKNMGEAGEDTMARHIGKSPTLLLPLQAGVCPFSCKGCPFAVDFPANKGKLTKQIGVEETRTLIQQSLSQAESHAIDTSDIGISFVGSGDATPNPFLKEIFGMVAAEFPSVSRIRFSTVAGKVQGGYSTPMQVVAKIISADEYKGKPKLSMQVSLHSSDEEKRARHVFEQRLNTPEVISGKKQFTNLDAQNMLLPGREVAKQFEQIVQAQIRKGVPSIRKPALSFVCSKDTRIDINELENYGFNPDNTIIQLRPLLSENPADSMSEEDFSQLYSSLRESGYDVVLMPVSPSGVELKA